jgi:DNA polymerase IIIc chi subunit
VTEIVEKISLYISPTDLMYKSVSTLVEKCYYSSLKVLIFSFSKEEIKLIDNYLWSYSKKHFIPHATNADPFIERQPVLITDTLKNLNDADCLVLINFNLSKVNFLEFESFIGIFKRIIAISDTTNQPFLEEFIDKIKTSKYFNIPTDLFIQQENGSWKSKSSAKS